MKASDFYKNQLLSESPNSHDNKFNHGKNLYSDIQADYIIAEVAKVIDPNSSVLELGTFTGRITRKIEKHFHNITVSEVDKDSLPKSNYPKLSIDLSQPIAINKKFDLVVSLGHQVSLSNNIKQAIKNISSLVKDDGLIVFDIWNLKDRFFYNNKPSYEMERITKEQCIVFCKENNLKIIEIYYGPRLNNIFGKYSNYILQKLIRRENLLSKIYIFCERFFSKTKNQFLENMTSSIIIIAKKQPSYLS